jgi:hypothetical protein
MQHRGTPRGPSIVDLSAFAVAFLICLAVIAFSWPKAQPGASDRTLVAASGEVQTAGLAPNDLGPPIPQALRAATK